MKKGFRFYAVLGLFGVLVLAGCGAGSEVAPPAAVAVDSAEAQHLLGRWEVNQGRFGHKIFGFMEDGRLLIEDVAGGETIEMTYQFVGENTLVISGYDEFNGSATVNFYENKLDFTINFDGTIFGELYSFTRVEES